MVWYNPVSWFQKEEPAVAPVGVAPVSAPAPASGPYGGRKSRKTRRVKKVKRTKTGRSKKH